MSDEIKEDIVRVLRLVEYEGPRSLVEKQIENSITGTKWGHGNSAIGRVRITAVTLDQFPQVLEEARRIPVPEDLARLLKDNQEIHADLEKAYEHIDYLQDKLKHFKNPVGEVK